MLAATSHAATCLAPPLGKMIVTSPFGLRDLNKAGEIKMHKGLDLRSPVGNPVFAGENGKAVRIGPWTHGGLAVFVQGQDGRISLFGHLRKPLIHLGPVTQGEVVAESGNTGHSTGPHLHFEVHPDGVHPVDPNTQLCAAAPLADGTKPAPVGPQPSIIESKIAGKTILDNKQQPPAGSTPGGPSTGSGGSGGGFSQGGTLPDFPNVSEHGALSLMETMASESTRRFLVPGWFDSLAQMRSPGLIRELLFQTALDVYLNFQNEKVRRNIELLLAKRAADFTTSHGRLLQASAQAAARQSANAD